MPGEESVEPTFEDIELIMRNVGFNILKTQTGVRTKYAMNPRSMLKTEYESLFWICKKPEDYNENGNYDNLSANFTNKMNS